MNDKSVFSAFSDYVKDVFDMNADGKISLKEILSLFSNSAVAIAFLVVDLLVAVAEYRVWDVGMKITGDSYKAIGFVLVSALPFYLAQVLWLYPRAHVGQQAIALLMGGSALVTSARFGLADLSEQYDVNALVQMVIYLTVAYIVMLLLYVLTDKTIRMQRMKVKAMDNARFQKDFNKIARDVLADLRITKEEEDKIRAEFGDAAVDSINRQLQKRKDEQKNGQQKNETQSFKPVNTMALDVDSPNPTSRQQS